MKTQQVFARANQIQKAISEQSFEARRMDKGEIKRLLALYFDASMYGEQMPDSDGEQFFDIVSAEKERWFSKKDICKLLLIAIYAILFAYKTKKEGNTDEMYADA